MIEIQTTWEQNCTELVWNTALHLWECGVFTCKYFRDECRNDVLVNHCTTRKQKQDKIYSSEIRWHFFRN